MVKLTVVTSAYNEESNIEECLDSVIDIADEIIVVDSSSTDRTVEIAKACGAKVVTQPNHVMLNVNKNYGFKRARGEWVLNLDADERVTPELAKEIKEKITKADVVGYWVPRKNIIFGKWIRSQMWWPDYQLRLFRNGKGKFPERHVHEYISVDGPTEKLAMPMIHKNYTTVSQYLRKMDTIYTENEVDTMLSAGRKVIWIDAIRFPVRDFLKTFFLQKGYTDGLHGLVLSFLQAFYAEVVFAKLWERQGFVQYEDKNFLKEVYKEFKKIRYEFHYWFLTSLIDHSKGAVKKIILRALRKHAAIKLRK